MDPFCFHDYVRVTQGVLGLKKKKLMDYFWDCPELVQALEKKELKEIHEVINVYIERCTPDIK